jgi:transposase
MMLYALDQRVFLCDTYVKYGQTIHNLKNKFRTTGLLIDKKQKHKGRVLTEDKLDDIGARLEHTSRKSLNRLVQENGMSNSSARTATQLLKLSFNSVKAYRYSLMHAIVVSRKKSHRG